MQALVLADRETQRQLEAFFLRRDFGVRVCDAVAEAREALAEETFAFVLLDLEDDEDGALELCRSIRDSSEGAQTCVLVLPAAETPQAVRAALAAGADDYLLKPIRESVLKLRLAFGQRHLAANRQTSARLEGAQRRYRTLLETMKEGMFQVDDKGVIEFANSRFSEITGFTLDELVGETADELLVTDEVRARLPGQTLLGTGTGSEEYSIPLCTKHDESIWVNLTAAPMPADDGEAGGSIGLIEDISVQREAEEDLRHREEYFRVLLETATDLITILDLDGRVLYQNQASEELLGWKSGDLVGRDFRDFLHQKDRARFQSTLSAALETAGDAAAVQIRFRHRDDHWRFLETLCNNLVDNPVVGGVVLTSRDVTERLKAENDLKRERAFFEQLFRNSPSGTVILDTSNRVRDVNRAFVDLFQWEIEELEKQPLHNFIVPDNLREEADELSDLVRKQQNVVRETVRKRKDGSEVDVAILGYPIVLGGKTLGVFGLYSDITERKNAERKLFHDAFHDPLTGLPNRTLLDERLERDLRRAKRRSDYQFALLFIDLDRFKAINDELGHAVGDELLKQTAERLQGCLRPGDTVARLGGDEFTVLVEDIRGPYDAALVANRILDSLAKTYEIGSQQVAISGSVGIAFSTSGYERVEDLMRDADMAMYRAKSQGRGSYDIFDPKMDLNDVEQLRLDKELGAVLDSDQLVLSYQPVVALSTGRIAGFEALVRWLHPERGLLLPKELLAACRESGLIVRLGSRVIAKACRQVQRWLERFPDSDAVRVTVNLSRYELAHPELLTQLDRTLEETGVNPATLGFEITEAAIQEAVDDDGKMLWELHRRGCRLVVDDFGSGQMSLQALHRFPLEMMKVDRAFVAAMRPGGAELEVLRAAAALGDSLGLGVAAKGIETQEQLDRLRQLGFGFGQGYHFSSPLPAEEAEALIAEDKFW
jgi:Amt family ammonium transporter